MLAVPFKIYLNTDETAVIVTTNANVFLKTVARSEISIQPVGTDNIRLFKNDTTNYLYTDILNAAGATYGASRDLAAIALSNLMGFNKGNGGTVTAVTASLPLLSSGGTAPNIIVITQDVIIVELSLVAGTVTYNNPALTVNSRCIGYCYTGVGSNSSVPIIATPANGSMTFSTGQLGDTATFVAQIIVNL